MVNYTVSQIQESQWIEVAQLIAQAIPNALISKLGVNSGAIFYSKIVEQNNSCGYIALDNSGNMLGVIVGSTDYHKTFTVVSRGQLFKLLMCSSFRLFHWSIINWVAKGIIARFQARKTDPISSPSAELVVIAIRPQARGSGLAQELINKMEDFMASKAPGITYKILTEKVNVCANKFYKKIGATFVRTNLHHGREINEWHKKVHL